MNEHESAFVNAFVLSNRRARYLSLLDSGKGQSKFRDRLSGALLRDLDRRYLFKDEDVASGAATLIRELGGNPVSFVWAEDPDLHRKFMTLDAAMSSWDSLSGIVISILPGRLAYYRPERFSSNYTLFRTAPKK